MLYSYKYGIIEATGPSDIQETDFIIVHPSLGYMIIEVKQGDISRFRGDWLESKGESECELHKDPMEQAQSAMFRILELYKKKYNRKFPLNIRFGLCFPECSRITGELPSHIKESSIWLYDDIESSAVLEGKLIETFGGKRLHKMKIQ